MQRLVLLVAMLGAPAAAQIHKFQPNQPGTRNLGVWRLTHDPAIRDEGNYHNIQCWSANGRFTCYTHWGGDKGPGGKGSAQVHVVDLATGKDRRVDAGINPRWANLHNWLFYCHWTGNGKLPYETGTQLIRYDADTGEKVVIAYGMECPGSLDSTDSWLYGTQRYRGQKPEFVTVRVRPQPGSKLERVKGAPNLHAFVHVNPFHPVIMVRAKDPIDPLYGTNRALFDLDGGNVRKGSVMCQSGHTCWSGDGQYLLIGNGQVRGRPWNKPFPSDLEVLAWGGVGDICPCGKSGRFICGGNLYFVDTRSGDEWCAVKPRSRIIYPMAGDFSTRMDIDPKGSPDGTKIHYHSTCDIEHTPVAAVTKFDPKQPDVIHVDSTQGFPDSGDLVNRWEVIGYERKTATAFEGITRQKYGTRKWANPGTRKAKELLPLSAYLLPAAQKSRAQADRSMLRAGIAKDNPLLFQRQTDCYIVVTRRPDRPHLRLRRGVVELIPGECHWETRGYRILRDGEPVTEKLFNAGQAFNLERPGAYTAIAVEWSGLESVPSLALELATPAEGRVLADAPKDFSWTREAWRVDGKEVSRKQALAAPMATMELVHMHDGVIAREQWRQGRKAWHVDLNREGKPIRRLEYQDGRLAKRTYVTPQGYVSSVELFGPDGFKTEYMRYRTQPCFVKDGKRGPEHDHWWYDKGMPVKKTRKGRPVFDATGKN